MIMTATKRNSFTLVAAAFLVIGCTPSDRPKDLPELVPCRLTLIQDGTPLDNAMLFFYRTDKAETEKDWMLGGVTDTKGVCQPKAIGKFPGLIPGTYKVAVKKVWMEPRNDLPNHIQDSLPDALEVNLVAPKYANKETTPLDITVKKGEKNDFLLTLDAPPGGAVIPDPSKWPSTKHRK